jgi:hypothetical protein
MGAVDGILHRYRRLAEMPGVPNREQLDGELTRRGGAAEPERAGIVEAMLGELDAIQLTTDNRCDAVIKLGAFLGTGLAVLAKFDPKSPIPGLGVAVVVLSGFSLGLALLAKNSPVRRQMILLPPTLDDLDRSCRELVQNEVMLILASWLLFAAIAVSLLAVSWSVLR